MEHVEYEARDPEVRRKVAAQLERVAEEEREWAEARLHHRLHGTWSSPDECPTCQSERENREGDPAFNGAFVRW